MNKEQIEQLAVGLYPIQRLLGSDYNFPHRKKFIKALQKASELLYTEEQVRQVYRIAASDTHKALLPELEDEAIQYIQSLKQ